jgi:uncharacterized protein
MSRQLTPKSSVETLKKEARRWLKALRSGDAEARSRLQLIHPRAAAAPGLRDIQHALALEHGLASWTAIKEKLADAELSRRSHGERVSDFLEHAVLTYGIPPATEKGSPSHPDDVGRRQHAARILREHPEVSRDSIHTAVLCGDISEVERLLSERPESASEKGGIRRWAPLLYLCFGRLPIAAVSENAVTIARALLDRGADPNVFFTDGENRFTPLTGVMGEGERSPSAMPPHPQAEALVQVLLERGADPHDRQGLYNTALWHDDDRWLELLWAHARTLANPVAWKYDGKSTLDFLLDLAVGRNHTRRTEWLLAHGANPNARGHYTKQSAHRVALLGGLTDMAALLVRFGAEPVALGGQEAFHAACMRLDRRAARQMLEEHPKYLRAPGPVMAAAQHDLPDVAALLLDLGMSPDLDDHGHRPLHTAASSDSPGVAALLVERGADVDAREWKYGGTPLDWARHYERPRMVALLAPLSRDVFALVAAGCLERLRQLLAAEPELGRAVRGNETPLFCLPEEEDQAVEIVELLLAHGADPTIRNGSGQTAADCAEKRGFDDAADLLRR